MAEKTEQMLLDALKKENKELKENEKYRVRSRKVSDMLMSILVGFLAWMAVEALVIFAKYGVNAAVNTGDFSQGTGTLWIAIFAVCKLLLCAYILWHVFFVNVCTFQEEIKEFANRVKVYAKGGKEAIRFNEIAEELGVDPEEIKGKSDSEIKTLQKTLNP